MKSENFTLKLTDMSRSVSGTFVDVVEKAVSLCVMIVLVFLMAGEVLAADPGTVPVVEKDCGTVTAAVPDEGIYIENNGMANVKLQAVSGVTKQGISFDDPVRATPEILEALAGTSFEAKVTAARLSSNSINFTYTFEYEKTIYEGGISYYETGLGEEGFLEYFTENYGSITDSDGSELTFEDLSVNDKLLISIDENGDIESVMVTGHEEVGLLSLLAGGFLAPIILLAAVCLIRRFSACERGRRLPTGRIAAIFLVEALIVIPIAFIESWIDIALIVALGEGTILYIIANAFLMAAMVEELGKFMVMLPLSWRSRRFEHRYDGVIFAVAASMGLSAIENVFYLMQYGMDTFLTRSLWASPGHCADAVFMGYFYSEAKEAAVSGDRKKCGRSIALAIAVPILIHGFYDVLCNAALISWFGLSQLWVQRAVAIILYVVAIRLLIYCVRRNSPFRNLY